MITPILVIGGALGFTLVLARLGRGRVTMTDGEGVRFGGFNALRALAALWVVPGPSLTTPSLDWLPRAPLKNMATRPTPFFLISGFLLYPPFSTPLPARRQASLTP